MSLAVSNAEELSGSVTDPALQREMCLLQIQYKYSTSAQTTACCNSGINKTQTFSKRKQNSSSVHHECPALVQSVTRVYPTPWHMVDHPRNIRVGYEDNKMRLFTPIHSKTPSFQRRGLHLGAKRERPRSTLRGDDSAGKRSQSESCFYSRYFLVPKKDGGLRPILDLRCLNHALMRRLFRMITLKQILSQIRTGDWLFSLDLEDAHFHIQITPHHIRFLRFAFEGVAYSVHGPSLCTVSGPPHFYEVHGRGSFPSKTDGNPHSQLPRRLAHSGPVRGGATIAQIPSPQPPRAPGSQGQFRQEPAGIIPGNSSTLSSDESSGRARTRFSHRETRGLLQKWHCSPHQSISEDAGPHGRSIASATAGPASHAAPSTLVEMWVPPHAWRHGCLHIWVSQACVTALAPWRNPHWIEKGVAMGMVCSRKAVTTDASNTVFGGGGGGGGGGSCAKANRLWFAIGRKRKKASPSTAWRW